MEIQENLLTDARENSGSVASNRLDFQKDWAICKLLELHDESLDYLLILDLHDDVVILDSSNNPQNADFFQVKTNEKNKWSLNELLKIPKSKKNKTNSIIGKLYHNKVKFQDNARSLHLVSNASYDVDLANSKNAKKTRICATELKDKQSLIDCLSDELKVSKEEIKGGIIFFDFTDLSIHSHSDATKGKISAFIEKRNPEKYGYKLGTIYRAIFDEIKTKTNKEIKCVDFGELISHKSFSRTEFEKILHVILKEFNQDDWPMVNQNLTSSGFILSEIRTLKSNWDTFSMEKLDNTNLLLQEIRKKIKKIIGDLKGTEIKDCKDLFEKTLSKYNSLKNQDQKVYQEDYLKAIILQEYFSNAS